MITIKPLLKKNSAPIEAQRKWYKSPALAELKLAPIAIPKEHKIPIKIIFHHIDKNKYDDFIKKILFLLYFLVTSWIILSRLIGVEKTFPISKVIDNIRKNMK